MITFGPILLVLPIRLRAFSRMESALNESPSVVLFRLPWREFWTDVILWTIAGAMMVVIYEAFFEPYTWTHVKVLLTCFSAGLFAGMYHFLGAENRVIDTLIARRSLSVPSGSLLTVSKKIMLLIVSLLVFMALAILMMVALDIYYLLENPSMSRSELYWGVFKEIVFALAIMLFFSVMIVRRYARNLRKTFNSHISAMDGISQGDLDAPVPVLSNDEFVHIAAKTNAMIQGLREREICHASFEKYVSPEISEKILRGEISPEGEMVTATILFCDLRGYTGFVEKKTPPDVVRFLNAYFSQMERIIRKHGGIVLQYIGDEIEAVFGGPTPNASHASQAVAAALEMRQALDRINAERRQVGEEPVHHGIGIHTGQVLAGNVGSPDRMVYAMVGDVVNVASRLQVLNKQCGTDILISRNTKEDAANDRFQVTSMGTFPVRGKTETIDVYTVDSEATV